MRVARNKVIVEDAGKKNAAATAEVRALIARHGEDGVRIRALARHRVQDLDLIAPLYPRIERGTIGCIIVVTAGDDGFVFVEDADLEIIYTETLAAFIDRTRSVDPDVVARFYLSLL